MFQDSLALEGTETECATTGEYSATWPKAGMLTCDGDAFRLLNWERRINVTGSGLSPTPKNLNKEGETFPSPVVPNGGRRHNFASIFLEGHTLRRKSDGSKAQLDLETHTRIWPSPRTSMRNGPSPAEIEAGDPKMRLERAVEVWPTPKARDTRSAAGVAFTKRHSQDLNVAVQLWPTPTVDAVNDRNGKYKQGGTSLNTAVRTWPTPTVNGNRNHVGSSPKAGDGLETAVAKRFPTPRVSDANGPQIQPNKQGGLGLNQLLASPQGRDWRQGHKDRAKGGEKERTQTNLNDQIGGRLNSDWVEWLMGWPIGWTSLQPLAPERFAEWKERSEQGTWWDEEPADLPRLITGMTKAQSKATARVRRQRLTALGNGQVPLCAAAAYLLLSESPI